MNNSTNTPILDDDAIARLESLPKIYTFSADIDALCQTVRVLRERLSELESSNLKRFPLTPYEVRLEESRQELSAILERERDDRSCNDDNCPIGATMVGWPHSKDFCLQSQLEQVTKERDAEKKDHQLTIDTFRQQEKIWEQKHDDGVQLCRDKAAEYEKSAEDFKHDDRLRLCLSSKREAYSAMAIELEQLK